MNEYRQPSQRGPRCALLPGPHEYTPGGQQPGDPPAGAPALAFLHQGTPRTVPPNHAHLHPCHPLRQAPPSLVTNLAAPPPPPLCICSIRKTGEGGKQRLNF